jgi:vacuolar-type H+-ATPase subunit E/Vma4
MAADVTSLAEVRQARRAARSRKEQHLKRVVFEAAVDYIDKVPGATYATLEAAVIVWREWVRRRRPVHF